MGLIDNRVYYTYEDLTIKPCVVSNINHRVECNPFDKDGMLPLFTAPMDTVINEENFNQFELNKITSILPRIEQYPIDVRVTYATGGKWAAFSLDEFIHYFCTPVIPMFKGFPIKALIDVANGHMQRLLDAAKKAKSIWGKNLILMGGNIANEEAYELYADAGFEYVRVGIGGGKGCLSTSNTGVHKPMASLVNDTYLIKKKLEEEIKADPSHKLRYEKLPYIIADGGIRGYRDIIKAIALGADYVMIGSVFAKMAESAAPKEEKDGELFATFYGMASREGQIAMNGEKTKTSEGIKKLLKVEYTMEGWTKNFTDYLRSAMSYLGVNTLDDVREKTVLLVNSQNAVNAVNK